LQPRPVSRSHRASTWSTAHAALNDDEMSILMSLVGPIEHHRRPQFLQEVAQELEAKRQAGEVGKGSVHRMAPTIQRKYFDPSQLPNASPGHRGSAA
jgi:hypothetical protein